MSCFNKTASAWLIFLAQRENNEKKSQRREKVERERGERGRKCENSETFEFYFYIILSGHFGNSESRISVAIYAVPSRYSSADRIFFSLVQSV